MKRNSILLCILFAITANFIAPAAKAQVNTTDSLALVDLYNSTDGANWDHNTNWLTPQPVSTWYGVELDSTNRVVNIILFGNNLYGALPASIGNLTSLNNLNLNFNYLPDTIPSSMYNLTNLSYLGLHGDYLSGTISPEIGNLTALTGLSLSDNNLTGTIPAEIGNLTNLNYLGLEENQLTGTIPATIGNLTNLILLTLNNNGLTGTIPAALGNLTNLTTLYLYSNQLTGTIPFSIGNLVNINYLYLYSNQLTGTIPSSLGSLTKLEQLFLNNNQFSGAIPAEIGSLKHLEQLRLDFNQLSGAIPASLDKLKNCSIDLRDNHLSQFGDFYSSKDTNYQISCYIAYNLFTFTGLQPIAENYPNVHYAPQDTILPIHQNGNTLSVSAGGTPGKNTYFWHRVGDTSRTIIKKDSTFSPAQSGMYYVVVNNKVVKGLALHSDTVSYTMPLAQTRNNIANVAALKTITNHFSIYPNPASTTIHIQTTGTATIILTNSAGKILLTKTINNSDAINVSAFANGTYYIQNKTTGEVQKIIITH